MLLALLRVLLEAAGGPKAGWVVLKNTGVVRDKAPLRPCRSVHVELELLRRRISRRSFAGEMWVGLVVTLEQRLVRAGGASVLRLLAQLRLATEEAVSGPAQGP